MGRVQKGRFTADVSSLGDEAVVFLIGMRINKPWKVGVWWPVFVAMPKMLNYLAKQPDKGLLGYEQAFFPSPIIVQYWRSFEDLARFARNPDDPHLEPWRQFNRRVGKSGDVGIWHETYLVKTVNIETVYGNMPPYGLAAASAVVPVMRGKDSAAARIGATPIRRSGSARVLTRKALRAFAKATSRGRSPAVATRVPKQHSRRSCRCRVVGLRR